MRNPLLSNNKGMHLLLFFIVINLFVVAAVQDPVMRKSIRPSDHFLVSLDNDQSKANETWQLKQEKVDLPSKLSEKLAKNVDANHCLTVSTEEKLVAHFWFANSLDAAATPEQFHNGLTYQDLEVSTFLGVVEWEQAWTDFRHQEVPAGTYTLRYMLQPESDDHDQSAPYRDFCLLIPIEQDPGNVTIPVKKLIELSKSTPQVKHPVVMLLAPNHQYAEKAKIEIIAKSGWSVLSFKLAVRKKSEEKEEKPLQANLGFKCIIKGQSEKKLSP